MPRIPARFSLTAWSRNTLPCTGCEEQRTLVMTTATAATAMSLPDLPCGGADRMTDNLNCGTCGGGLARASATRPT